MTPPANWQPTFRRGDAKVVVVAIVLFMVVIVAIVLGMKHKAGKDRRAGRAQLVQQVGEHLDKAAQRAGAFEFDQARQLLATAEDEVERSRFADIETYDLLSERIASARTRLREVERDYERKIDQGWVVVDQKLVSASERERILLEEERRRIEAEKKQSEAKQPSENAARPAGKQAGDYEGWGLKVAAPEGWQRTRPGRRPDPRVDLRFWTRGGPELIKIRRQKLGLLNEGAVQEGLGQKMLVASFCGFDIVEGDVRTVGGKKAAWLVWKAKKDDGSERREQCVEVEIPRKDDTIYISLSAPEEEFDTLLPTFKAMLETVEFTGD